MVIKQEDLDIGPITDLELGWLAGLWEGEGHFGYDRTQLAHLRTTDYDVIIRMKLLIERVLKLQKPINLLSQEPIKGDKTLYGIQTYGAIARAIMKLLLPHMGSRRRGQIWRSLNEYRPKFLKLPDNFVKGRIK